MDGLSKHWLQQLTLLNGSEALWNADVVSGPGVRMAAQTTSSGGRGGAEPGALAPSPLGTQGGGGGWAGAEALSAPSTGEVWGAAGPGV